MKKLLTLVMTVVASLMLVACGQKQTADFQKFQDGVMDMRNHVEANGDKVTILKTTTTLLYEPMGLASADDAKKAMEQEGAKQWDGIKGVDHQIEYQSDRLVETTMIDFSKADLKENADLFGITTETGDAPQYVSYKLTVENQKKLGLTKVIDGKFQSLD